MSMKIRTPEELADGVKEWIQKKYHHDSKQRLRNALYPGDWRFELVIHRVKFPEELALIEKHGIKIHKLDDIAASLSENRTLIQSAAGSDLLELVMLGRQ